MQVKALGNYEQKQESLKNLPPFPRSSSVEAPEQQWNQTWGGHLNDTAASIAIDSTNNIYITGTCDITEVPSTSAIGKSLADYKSYQPPPPVETTGYIVLLKYDDEGNYQWGKTWGLSGRNDGRSVVVDSSDNIYVLGRNANLEPVLLKYDSSGTLQWNTSWTNPDGAISANAMDIDTEDNIFITGSQSQELILWKFNNMGHQLWEETWGDEDSSESGWAVAVDTLNNIYVSGFLFRYSTVITLDQFLLKFDSTGDLDWEETWGGSNYEFANSIALDSSNNIFVAGATSSYGAGDYDLSLLKYNSYGRLQWDETWGGSDYEFGMDMLNIDSEDNIYLAARTSSFGAGMSDGVLVKFNNSGDLQWDKTWGGIGYDSFISLEIDTSDNLFVLGTTQILDADEEDIILVKYGASHTPFDISGYDMLLPFGFIGLISVIFMKKSRMTKRT
ncbi:MAG: SBBP repeat-containing protein [Promethearchaeota archaeon]